MSKAPAFQFYPGDFLTGTTFMSNAEVGLFIRLLCLQAEQGSVPDDVERICRVYGEEARGLWPAVRAKFNHGSTGSTMVNERMVRVLAARDAFRERQVAAGKASAQKRSNQTSTEAQPLPEPKDNHGSTTVEPIEDRDRVSISSVRKERAKPPTLPKWSTDKFKEAWAKWKAYKAEKRSPYKPIGEQAALTKLGNEFATEADCITAIENSMAQNYQGIFPPKATLFTKSNGTLGYGKEQAEAEMAAIRKKNGRDPVWGAIDDMDCSRELLIYLGQIKAPV